MNIRSLRRNRHQMQGPRAIEEARFIRHMKATGRGASLERIGPGGVKAALLMAHRMK